MGQFDGHLERYTLTTKAFVDGTAKLTVVVASMLALLRVQRKDTINPKRF